MSFPRRRRSGVPESISHCKQWAPAFAGVTNNEFIRAALASNLALNHLLPALVKNHKVHVFLSSKVGAALPFRMSYSSLNFFEQGLACLAATAPDLVLSIRYGGILKDRAIAIPSMGVLNLHSGLLPDYRGVMATFYALLNRESEIGMTLHTILDAGIDTGDIIDSTREKPDTGHSYLWNVLQLYPAGVDLMLASVKKCQLGRSLPIVPSPKAEITIVSPQQSSCSVLLNWVFAYMM